MKLRNKLYQVIDQGEKKRTLIQIIDGKYLGLTVAYGEVGFRGTQEEPILHFIYEIVSNPYKVDVSDEDSLRQVLGDCLFDVMEYLFSLPSE